MKPETPAEPVCTEAGAPPCAGEAVAVGASDSCAPVSNAVSRVARMHRVTAGKLLKSAGIYPGQEFLMLHLWAEGPARQSELIKAVALDPSTVTKMLQRLEQTGLVRRSPDPADRRAVLVEATEQSCALRYAVQEAWLRLEEYTLDGLDEGERAELARLLGKVEGNLVRASGCGPEGGGAGGGGC
ncbi:MarR family winged helix-turn-helix transcriptional regulator [Streptomyces sp. NPDC050504]|uniref:MarR family winged helix-turn-helix transcriptional regulator n=1 Tax=Streptomyces sp. NPDC050504 TaxID=3365618 RepID=UPI0037AE9C12